MNKFKFSDNSLDRMKNVNADLTTVFLHALKSSPIDFGVPSLGGYRSKREQEQLFIDGLTKCDGVFKKSKHQSGEALDFYAYVDGRASWEKHHLALVAGVILSTAKRLLDEGQITHQLRWGGTFGSTSFDGWDMPHIELI